MLDAVVKPSGEASAGSQTRRKHKRDAERESQDEGSVDASLTSSQGKKDVARVSRRDHHLGRYRTAQLKAWTAVTHKLEMH